MYCTFYSHLPSSLKYPLRVRSTIYRQLCLCVKCVCVCVRVRVRVRVRFCNFSFKKYILDEKADPGQN